MTGSAHRRILKFSLVGGIGVGVQLGALSALVAIKTNYLLATALAVELAVLHNFFWHQSLTWADRKELAGQGIVARLLRFHLSNGLISLAGNLLLMRVLVGWRRVPLILANILTISVCFLANFLASDRWVFRESCTPLEIKPPRGEGMKSVAQATPVFSCRGQSWSSPASGPAYVAQREHR